VGVEPLRDHPGGDSPSEHYQRCFVPAIGAPLAKDLVERAALRPGERVLDLACGTGVVARLAAPLVGPGGAVVGLDLNPGMLAVARAATPERLGIEWLEAGAEAMPLPDGSFDVVLCQMGLQFIPDRHAALGEMRRVLAAGGRLLLNLPGPTPDLFRALADGLARHVAPEAAGFVHQVFSLHDEGELRGMLARAGFRDVMLRSDTRSLSLPAPEAFLWQYLRSTPLAMAVAEASDAARAALERDVVGRWQGHVSDDALSLEVRMVTVTGRS